MSDGFDISLLRSAMAKGNIQWHQHALVRCLERGISRERAILAVLYGEVIEQYLDDRPYPSCLILQVDGEPLHVVAAVDPHAEVAHIITVYQPDLERFEMDLKTRKKKT